MKDTHCVDTNKHRGGTHLGLLAFLAFFVFILAVSAFVIVMIEKKVASRGTAAPIETQGFELASSGRADPPGAGNTFDVSVILDISSGKRFLVVTSENGIAIVEASRGSR